MILWSSVSSSAIKQSGYEPSVNRLHIRFKRGEREYSYCHVPEEIYRAFLISHSKGAYYTQYIKGKYPC